MITEAPTSSPKLRDGDRLKVRELRGGPATSDVDRIAGREGWPPSVRKTQARGMLP
jgi:hypothetical protein